MKDHPYILVFLDYISDKLKDPQVLEAIDSFLSNLPFIKVCIKERLYDEDPMDVPEIRDLAPEVRECTLKLIWEERLRERYGCEHVKLKIKRGSSTYAEQHVSVLNVARLMASGSASFVNSNGLRVKVLHMPPGLSLPFEKSIDVEPDIKVVKDVTKSMATAFHHRNASMNVLIDQFGIRMQTALRILPMDKEMFQYFTIPQHVEKYIQDTKADSIGVDAFAEIMDLQPDSNMCKDMQEFFAICADVMTPAAWFMDKVASRYFHVSGVLPVNWENG